MIAPTQLILIRHGETAWTRERRYQGSSDIPLTAKGLEQSRKLGQALKKIGAHKIYASPLLRAQQTARAIGKTTGCGIQTDSRIKEMFFGDWEGRTAEELLRVRDPAFRRWSRAGLATPTGGESLNQLALRVHSFLKEILRRQKRKNIIVVSHGGPIKMMIFYLLKLPGRSLWSIRLDPASVTNLLVYPDFCQLAGLNLTLPAVNALLPDR